MVTRTQSTSPTTLSEATRRRLAPLEAYRQRIKSGEIESPVKYDANGNIIPSPSTSKPRSTVHIPAEIS